MTDSGGSPLRVLIVEDSEDDAVLIVRHLRRAGLEPSWERVDSSDGMEQALTREPWDLVITDHNMPLFSSTEALALVQEHGLDIPVIIVSGSIGEEIAVTAMKAGASDYIMKDNLARLVPAIERELREAHQRRDHRQAQDTIRHMAFHDALTGLVNRNAFEIRLRKALGNARADNATHALLYLDLDQFKIVNDTCGHAAGDHLLKRLTAILQRRVRGSDTIARLGGDEFGVLLENCPVERAIHVANDLLRDVQAFRFAWEKQAFKVSASIGVTVITAATGDTGEALSRADMACYTAKDRGRNRIHVDTDSDVEITRRQSEMQWVARINDALQEGRFVLFRQAIVPLSDDRLPRHSEVLLRLRERNGSLILPGVFIPAAERFDLMPQIDRHVLRLTIRHLALRAGERPRGTLFANLSGATLNDPAFGDFLDAELREQGVRPDLIGFEITETAAIANLATAISFLERVKALGCEVALDDFGCGMCSFGYLRSIPIDYIKIDGGFVQRILDDPMDCAIVESINQIGHVARLLTIAECVESVVVFDKLRSIGVDFAQGFDVEQPQPLELVPNHS
jgi:diguanylate cyclase (GGDEF)-like protein